MTEYVQVMTTTANRTDAEKIAGVLVEKKLAGCAQIIGPISSVYWWEEKIERASEWLCLMKMSKAMYEDLESTIRKIHPYKVPEILAMPIVAGNMDYLSWLDGVIGKTKQ
jgi:periplasmic divalent cation tolerance protein